MPFRQGRPSDALRFAAATDAFIFTMNLAGGKTKQIIFCVKAGHVQSAYVRDLRGVIEPEGAEIGVLICMEAPTKKCWKKPPKRDSTSRPGLRPLSLATDSYHRRAVGEQGRPVSANAGSDIQESAQVAQIRRRADSTRRS
jgi:hypothetical protein